MLKYFEIENTVIAELTDEKFIISQPQDILDLIGDSVSYNCSRLMIREQNLYIYNSCLLYTSDAADE